MITSDAECTSGLKAEGSKEIFDKTINKVNIYLIASKSVEDPNLESIILLNFLYNEGSVNGL